MIDRTRPWDGDRIVVSRLPDEAQFEAHPSGVITVDGVEAGHTVQCPHCGAHWLSVRGSGHIRGFCFRCNARTCGRVACAVCAPAEAQLEIAEGTRRHTILLPGHTF